MMPHGYAIGLTPYDLIDVQRDFLYTANGIETPIRTVVFGYGNIENATRFCEAYEARETIEEIKRRYDEISFENCNIFELVALERRNLDPDKLKVYRIVLYEEVKG